jgi:elongation factor Ts
MVSMEQVKELRDRTGVSVMQCQKALVEAEGDMEKAIIILKKQSGATAAKKAGRDALAGVIVAKKVGNKVVALTLNCETDFVAKNTDFLTLANTLLDKAIESGVPAAETVAAELVPLAVQKIGENIKLGSITEKTTDGVLGVYIHNGQMGTIVELSGGDDALAKDIAMHVTAMKPEYTTMEEIPAEAIASVKEVFAKEVDATKPADIQEKILAGKIDSYLRERVLLEQGFFKDTAIKVKDIISKAGATVKSVTKLDIA